MKTEFRTGKVEKLETGRDLMKRQTCPGCGESWVGLNHDLNGDDDNARDAARNYVLHKCSFCYIRFIGRLELIHQRERR